MMGRFEEKEGYWTTVVTQRGGDTVVARWEDLIAIFVDNLPESFFAEKLRKVFSTFGRVADSFIPASSRRGNGKCFGFVQ